ncbi:MAG: carotenoid biosynthesis protein [Ilumatobacteraceae bacterium]
MTRRRIATWAFLLAVVAMIATPLFELAGNERRVLAHVVVVALCAAVVAATATAVGVVRAVLGSVIVAVTTYLVELLGHTRGVPFGEYDYSDRLWPQVAGVPLIVPLAWVAITWCGWAVARKIATRFVTRVVVAAWSITAWDLFLDPQMVGEGYWTWQAAEPAYRDIPLTNFVGWFVTGLVVAAITTVIAGRQGREVYAGVARLVLVYTTLWVLSTIGFLFFFDDALVALVGGVGMGLPALASWRPRPEEPAL